MGREKEGASEREEEDETYPHVVHAPRTLDNCRFGPR